MKPIPGYPGHPWEITQRSEAGLPLKLRFARARGQVLDGQLRKHTIGRKYEIILA